MVEILNKNVWMIRQGFNTAGYVNGVKRGTPEYDALMDRMYADYVRGRQEVQQAEEQRVYDYANQQVQAGNEDVPDDWVGGDSSVTWSDVVSDIELTRKIRDARNKGNEAEARYYEAIRIKAYADDRISAGEVYAPAEVVGGQEGVKWSDLSSFYASRVSNRGYDRTEASVEFMTGVTTYKYNNTFTEKTGYVTAEGVPVSPYRMTGVPARNNLPVSIVDVGSNVKGAGVPSYVQGGTSMVNPAFSNMPDNIKSGLMADRIMTEIKVTSSLSYLERLKGEGVSEVVVGGVTTPINEAISQFQSYKNSLDPFAPALISSDSIVRNASYSDVAYNLRIGEWFNPASKVPMFDIQFTSTSGTPFYKGDDVPVNVARDPLSFIGNLFTGNLRAELVVSTIGEVNTRAYSSAIANIETLPLGIGTGLQWLGRRSGILAPEDKAGVNYSFWGGLVGANPTVIDNYMIGSSLSSGVGYWGMEVLTDKAIGELVAKGIKKLAPAKVKSFSIVTNADPSDIRGTSYINVKYGGFNTDIVSDFAGFGKSADSGLSFVELTRTGFVKGSSFIGFDLPISTDTILSSVDYGFSYAVSSGKSLGWGASIGFKATDWGDEALRGTINTAIYSAEGNVIGVGFTPDVSDFKFIQTGTSGVLGDIYTVKGAGVTYYVGGFDYGTVPVVVDVGKGSLVPYGIKAFDDLGSLRQVGSVGVGIQDVSGRAYSIVRVGSLGGVADTVGDVGFTIPRNIINTAEDVGSLGGSSTVRSTVEGLDLGTKLGVSIKSAVDVGNVKLAEDVVKSVDVALTGGSAGTLAVVSALPRAEVVSADVLVTTLPDISSIGGALPVVDTGTGGTNTVLIESVKPDVSLDNRALSVNIPKLESLSSFDTGVLTATVPALDLDSLKGVSTASLSLSSFDTGVLTATVPAFAEVSLDIQAIPSIFPAFDITLPPLPFGLGGGLSTFDFNFSLPEFKPLKKGYFPDFTALFFDLGGMSKGFDGLFSGLEPRGLDI